jgi:glycerol-3-phosphate dehydrogenase (NAD(P)+)
MPILVLGAGSWGTALAILLARNGQAVRLWDRDPARVATLREERCNARYLPGVRFPEALVPADDLASAVDQVREILIAVPVSALRGLIQRLHGCGVIAPSIALACKGIEPGTHCMVYQVVEEVLGRDCRTAMISGPSFASEVAADLPAAVTVASRDPTLAHRLVSRLHNGAFRAYTSEDVVGVAVGGAVKNVLAIAAGVADGLGFGANTRAALITRGLAEMSRLGAALGGLPATFTGLAGVGDLVLSCTDDQSRNRRFGIMLGRGSGVAQAKAAVGPVIEGIGTAHEVQWLARVHGVEMPISEQVVRLLDGVCQAREAVQCLLARDPRQEFDVPSRSQEP